MQADTRKEGSDADAHSSGKRGGKSQKCVVQDS